MRAHRRGCPRRRSQVGAAAARLQRSAVRAALRRHCARASACTACSKHMQGPRKRRRRRASRRIAPLVATPLCARWQHVSERRAGEGRGRQCGGCGGGRCSSCVRRLCGEGAPGERAGRPGAKERGAPVLHPQPPAQPPGSAAAPPMRRRRSTAVRAAQRRLRRQRAARLRAKPARAHKRPKVSPCLRSTPARRATAPRLQRAARGPAAPAAQDSAAARARAWPACWLASGRSNGLSVGSAECTRPRGAPVVAAPRRRQRAREPPSGARTAQTGALRAGTRNRVTAAAGQQLRLAPSRRARLVPPPRAHLRPQTRPPLPLPAAPGCPLAALLRRALARWPLREPRRSAPSPTGKRAPGNGHVAQCVTRNLTSFRTWGWIWNLLFPSPVIDDTSFFHSASQATAITQRSVCNLAPPGQCRASTQRSRRTPLVLDVLHTTIERRRLHAAVRQLAHERVIDVAVGSGPALRRGCVMLHWRHVQSPTAALLFAVSTCTRSTHVTRRSQPRPTSPRVPLQRPPRELHNAACCLPRSS
jgi:hypothetical protein